MLLDPCIDSLYTFSRTSDVRFDTTLWWRGGWKGYAVKPWLYWNYFFNYMPIFYYIVFITFFITSNTSIGKFYHTRHTRFYYTRQCGVNIVICAAKVGSHRRFAALPNPVCWSHTCVYLLSNFYRRYFLNKKTYMWQSPMDFYIFNFTFT